MKARRSTVIKASLPHSPTDGQGGFDGSRCDVYYQGALSPDFYGWVFPHGDTASVGVGTAQRGFSLRPR